MANILKAGQCLPQYEMVGVIEKIIPYLDELYLLNVIAQCTARREEMRRAALHILNDEGWWNPRSADEVMTDDAKMLILGIRHPIVNPSGTRNKIQAIKYLRAQQRGPQGNMSLREAKDLVEAYEYCVEINRIAYPEYLLKDWDNPKETE